MRMINGYEETLFRTQANLVCGGLNEALAIQFGEDAPRIGRVVVVVQGELSDGRGIRLAIGFDDLLECLSSQAVFEILAEALALQKVCDFQEGEPESSETEEDESS